MIGLLDVPRWLLTAWRTRCNERWARRALRAAVDGDLHDAKLLVADVRRQRGSSGVHRMIVTWCDALLARHPDLGPLVHLHFLAPCGEVDAGQVIAPVRWAGRIVAARAAGDDAMFEALCGALPPDPYACGEHLGTLLGIVAASLIEEERCPGRR